ncbi:MAG: hypothetical protein ACK4I8_03105, partial [Armatimonadota bacterium]
FNSEVTQQNKPFKGVSSVNTLPLTPQELHGMDEQERKALTEMWELAKKGEVKDALQKAAKTFNEVWKLRTAVRVIYGELVWGGHRLEQAYLKVKEALQKIKPKGKRRVMEEGLEDHHQDVHKFAKVLREVTGIWADHPEFEGVDVRTWRRKLWN